MAIPSDYFTMANQLKAARLALARYIDTAYEREDFDRVKVNNPAASRLSDLENILNADPKTDNGFIRSELNFQKEKAALNA